MKVFAIAMFMVGLVAAGGDMVIDFPLYPRADPPSGNLMTFSGSLGAPPDPITQSSDKDRPFQVDGNTFTSLKQAWKRSCDNQKNNCANFANSDAGRSQGLTVKQCDDQHSDCENAVDSATQTAFASFTTQDANFDYYCEN